MSTPDIHTLSGAYALDALTPVEGADFRRHLEGCSACRDEVRELRSAAAEMGAGVASAPPPGLKARVLEAADRTAQRPPEETGAARTAPQAEEPRPAQAPARLRAPGSWRSWIALAAAAVVLVAGGAIGVRQLVDPGEPELAGTAAAVFNADDARTATVGTANGGRLTVGVSPSRNQMAVDTRDLPPLDEGEVYQFWADHNGRTTSAVVLADPEKGAAMGMPAPDTTVFLTIEPAGGSERPTGTRLAELDPAAV